MKDSHIDRIPTPPSEDETEFDTFPNSETSGHLVAAIELVGTAMALLGRC